MHKSCARVIYNKWFMDRLLIMSYVNPFQRKFADKRYKNDLSSTM